LTSVTGLNEDKIFTFPNTEGNNVVTINNDKCDNALIATIIKILYTEEGQYSKIYQRTY